MVGMGKKRIAPHDRYGVAHGDSRFSLQRGGQFDAMSEDDTGREREWERILACYREGDVIAGLVTREVNGGLLLNVGTVDDFAVFLPASQADMGRPLDLGNYVGKTLECKILKIDATRRNLVVSRRRLLEEGRADTC